MYKKTMETPIGKLFLTASDTHLVRIDFDNGQKFEDTEDSSDIIALTIKQLNEYFVGERKEFSVPMDLIGTDFRKSAWNALYKIPYGEVRTYKDIAVMVGNPKGCRAVGGANHHNPIPIIIPCHRVVGTGGKLTGFGGGIWRKEWLLEHEKKGS